MCERGSAQGSGPRLAVPRRRAGRVHAGRQVPLFEYALLPTGDACPPVVTVFWRQIQFAPFPILEVHESIL